MIPAAQSGKCGPLMSSELLFFNMDMSGGRACSRVFMVESCRTFWVTLQEEYRKMKGKMRHLAHEFQEIKNMHFKRSLTLFICILFKEK